MACHWHASLRACPLIAPRLNPGELFRMAPVLFVYAEPDLPGQRGPS
jgi:hypothetical protein